MKKIIEGLGADSVCKGLEFKSPALTEMPVMPVLGIRDRKLLRAHWLISLVSWQAVGPVRDPVSKNKLENKLGR